MIQVKPGKIESVEWEKVMGQLEYDKEVGPTEWAQPGTNAGLRLFILHHFFYYLILLSDHSQFHQTYKTGFFCQVQT